MKQTNNPAFEEIAVTHKVKNIPRDFFRIPIEDLQKKHLTVNVTEKLDLTEKRYVSFEMLNQWDDDIKETVVFNLPTNTGKSELFYSMIKKYAKEEGNLVLVCSPYIKLVNKDFNAIKKYIDLVTHYDRWRDVDDESSLKKFDKVTDIKVHVLTINCLLRNPGESNDDINETKQVYLDHLLREATQRKLCVYLFIDEIHDSVHNFKPHFLPHLIKWQPVLKKIFVASATFTPNSYAVVQFLAKLTNRCIRIYESDRDQLNSNPANLTVHILPSQLNSSKSYDYNFLAKYVNTKSKTKVPVNILTWSKSLARQLETQNSELSKCLDNINLVIGDTKNEFSPDKNNIGTTFKTGVNITDIDNIYIIIFPPSNYYDIGGIFESGLSSINQAFSRQRNGGTCHIVIPKPNKILEGTYLYKKNGEPLFKTAEKESYLSQNDQLNKIISSYKRNLSDIEEQIKIMKDESKALISISYPSEQDYLLSYDTSLKNTDTLSEGKGLSAYILWALCNNQFDNVRLNSVRQYFYPTHIINLNSDDDLVWTELTQEFPTLYNKLERKPLHKIYSEILEKLITENDKKILVKFKKTDNPFPISKAILEPDFKIWLLTQLVKNATRIGLKKIPTLPVDFKSYVNFILSNNTSATSGDLKDSIYNLLKCKKKLYNLIEKKLKNNTKGEILIPPNFYLYWKDKDQQMFKESWNEILKKDSILHSRVVKATFKPYKKDIFIFALKLFTNDFISSRDRRKIKGKYNWILPMNWKL